MKYMIFTYALASAFWFTMFSPWTGQRVGFWIVMPAAAGILACLGAFAGRARLRGVVAFRPAWILVGLASAAVLYLVFVAGNTASAALFEFAPNDVDRIYALRSRAPLAAIAGLLVLIATAEEIYWRGYLQMRLERKYRPIGAWLIGSLLYALAHVWALNFILLGAALVAGLFWGLLLLRCRSLWPGIISHVAWDVVIFVLLPVR